MESYIHNTREISRRFLFAGLFMLLFGLVWGLTGSLQYLFPALFKGVLSFDKIRPLHVSSMLFWILMGASGVVLYFMKRDRRKPGPAKSMGWAHLVLVCSAAILVSASYLAGYFGGREYWEFPPPLSLLLIAGWVLFIIQFLRTVRLHKKQPVYVWMWTTGLFFFLFTFLESYLWLIPWFNDHITHDMTVQWKSYGSMVGSWNMLIYGSSLFLMEKISQNRQYSNSPLAFALYGLGLFNLMFNWGHHIYTLPTASHVQYISYAVSMTELLILGNIIWQWKKSVSTARRLFHLPAYRFMVAADFWVFLNLALAICMSIPGINVYTHGTHVTVAHSMGTTIGINTFILMACILDIVQEIYGRFPIKPRYFSVGYWTSNASLLVFWLSLLTAGVLRSIWQMSADQAPFREMMEQVRPVFFIFFASGFGILLGLFLLVVPLLKFLGRPIPARVSRVQEAKPAVQPRLEPVHPA